MIALGEGGHERGFVVVSRLQGGFVYDHRATLADARADFETMRRGEHPGFEPLGIFPARDGLPAGIAMDLDALDLIFPATEQCPEVSATKERDVIATVKWFSADKGYGFLAPEDGGRDVFVHVTALEKAGIRSLQEGQKVSCDVVQERGKNAAANLKIVG